MAIYFTLFALTLILLRLIRGIIIYDSIGIEGYFPVIKRSMKAILLSSAIIITIIQLKNLTTRKMVDNGIVAGTIIMGIVCVFSDQLQNIGLNISTRISEYQGETIERTSGVGLDVNQFAALMLMSFGYFLSRIEVAHRKSYKYYAGCVFSVAGIVSTGSRAGLICLGIISAVFLLRNIKNLRYSIVIILTGILILSSNITAMKRMDTLGSHLDTGGGYGRAHRQIITMRYLFNHPFALITGSSEPVFHMIGTTRHIHNYYVSILYNYGAIVFTIYILMLYKLFRLEKYRGNASYSLIYPLLGFFLPKLTVAYGLFIYFPLIVAMASRDPNYQSEKQKPLPSITQ